MWRGWLQKAAAAAAVVALVSLALGQKNAADRKAASKPLVGPPGGGGAPWYGVPGYAILSLLSVQKELGLSQQQKQELLDIASQYRKEIQRSWRQQWEIIRHLSPAEQQKHWAAQRDTLARRGQERIAAFRKKVEAVLTPQQLQRLKEIDFRIRAAAMLDNPATLDRLDATPEQREQLRKLREELQEKIYQLQRQTFEESFQLLSPQQQEKLREMATRQQG